jgi:hypothetical protein
MTNLQAHSASCPVCGYEHDFATKSEMNKAWALWQRNIRWLGLERKQKAKA